MKLNEGLSEEQFKDIILNMLKDNSEYEKDQYKFLPIDDLSKDSSIEKKYLLCAYNILTYFQYFL